MDYIELRRRLAQTAPAPWSEPAPSPPGSSASLPGQGRSQSTLDLLRRLEQVRRRGEQRPRPVFPSPEVSLAERLGGKEVAPGLVEVVRVHPLAYRHGAVPLRRLAQVDGDRSGALRHPGPIDPRRLLILDTETTGLAGGAGTVAFLLGVARLTDAGLELRQWLLTAFAGEVALLDRLAAALGEEDCLVSFNGKSFDIPLLDTRARLHGRDGLLRGRPHLDLLHALRRAHRRRLPDCRLKTAETELLGLRRADDLPGEFAPGVWRDWLRTGRAGRLNEVLAHNRDDLLSTAALLPVLAREEMRWGMAVR